MSVEFTEAVNRLWSSTLRFTYPFPPADDDEYTARLREAPEEIRQIIQQQATEAIALLPVERREMIELGTAWRSARTLRSLLDDLERAFGFRFDTTPLVADVLAYIRVRRGKVNQDEAVELLAGTP